MRAKCGMSGQCRRRAGLHIMQVVVPITALAPPYLPSSGRARSRVRSDTSRRGLEGSAAVMLVVPETLCADEDAGSVLERDGDMGLQRLV